MGGPRLVWRTFAAVVDTTANLRTATRWLSVLLKIVLELELHRDDVVAYVATRRRAVKKAGAVWRGALRVVGRARSCACGLSPRGVGGRGGERAWAQGGKRAIVRHVSEYAGRGGFEGASVCPSGGGA